jgi:hypothetical protein
VGAGGDIIIAGGFTETIDFGAGGMMSTGGSDIFVAKLDADKGDTLWSRSFGDISYATLKAIALDSSESVWLAGLFNGSIDFGGSTFSVTDTYEDLFVAKLDYLGNHAFSQVFKNNGAQSAEDISIDSSGNAVFVGRFSGSVDFGDGALTTSGLSDFDIFVTKIGPTGTHHFSVRFGDSGQLGPPAVSLDAQGNIVFVATCKGDVTFGGDNLAGAGGDDLCLVKLSPNGQHLWSRRFGDIHDQARPDITIDLLTQHIFIAGGESWTVDYGSGPLTSAGAVDILLARLAP